MWTPIQAWMDAGTGDSKLTAGGALTNAENRTRAASPSSIPHIRLSTLLITAAEKKAYCGGDQPTDSWRQLAGQEKALAGGPIECVLDSSLDACSYLA